MYKAKRNWKNDWIWDENGRDKKGWWNANGKIKNERIINLREQQEEIRRGMFHIIL